MDKQIVVHSIDHAFYEPQLISVVPKPTYSYGEACREGTSWVESVTTLKLLVQSRPLPHQGEVYSIRILGKYPFCLLWGFLINVITDCVYSCTYCTMIFVQVKNAYNIYTGIYLVWGISGTIISHPA